MEERRRGGKGREGRVLMDKVQEKEGGEVDQQDIQH